MLQRCRKPIFAVHLTECVSLAVATSALTHGILKLMAKIKASPCAFVKLADSISEMPAISVQRTSLPAL